VDTVLLGFAMLILYALALRLSVALVVDDAEVDNSIIRAIAISAGLTVISLGVGALPLTASWVGGVVVLIAWVAVVRWAYRIEWLETVVVGAAMLIVCLVGRMLLGQVLLAVT